MTANTKALGRKTQEIRTHTPHSFDNARVDIPHDDTLSELMILPLQFDAGHVGVVVGREEAACGAEAGSDV